MSNHIDLLWVDGNLVKASSSCNLGGNGNALVVLLTNTPFAGKDMAYLF